MPDFEEMRDAVVRAIVHPVQRWCQWCGSRMRFNDPNGSACYRCWSPDGAVDDSEAPDGAA